MLDKLTSADFRRYLNQKFLIRPETGETVEVELIRVDDLGNPSREETERRQPFSIIFRSSQRDTFLPQRIYRIENEQMGSLEIFLVPIGPDKFGMQYEAIFA